VSEYYRVNGSAPAELRRGTPMPLDERLCIICDARKPRSCFERKGEHIVPRSLGSRKLRTPHVCRECNGGFGATVDLALKNVFTVSVACIDRGVVGTRGSGFSRQNVDFDLLLWGCRGNTGNRHRREINLSDNSPRENPDVKGAVLKIAYEAAHLRLGDDWLREPTAAAVRNVLFAYVSRDREKAHELMSGITVHDIPIDVFYFAMGKSRSEYVKRAIISKSCLNSLWLAPVRMQSGEKSLAIVFDIEGLPPGYVAVSDSNENISVPELLAPKQV